MRKVIDIRFKFGNNEKNTTRYIEWFEFAKKTIDYHLSKLQSEKIDKIMHDSVEGNLSKHKVRLHTDRMRRVMKGFKSKYQREGSKLIITGRHSYLDGNDGTFTYTTKGGNQFKIKGSQILRLLDAGRGTYQIPTEPHDGQILFWRYGSTKIRYQIGSRRPDGSIRGPIIVAKFLGKKSPKRGGTRFLRQLKADILAYVATVQNGLKRAVKRKEASL